MCTINIYLLLGVFKKVLMKFLAKPLIPILYTGRELQSKVDLIESLCLEGLLYD